MRVRRRQGAPAVVLAAPALRRVPRLVRVPVVLRRVLALRGLQVSR